MRSRAYTVRYIPNEISKCISRSIVRVCRSKVYPHPTRARSCIENATVVLVVRKKVGVNSRQLQAWRKPNQQAGNTMMLKNTNRCHDPSVFQRLVMVCRQAYGNAGAQQFVENPKKIVNRALRERRLVGVALIGLLVNALILSIAIPAAAQSPLWARRAKIFGTPGDI